jgi:hypothetical protein
MRLAVLLDPIGQGLDAPIFDLLDRSAKRGDRILELPGQGLHLLRGDVLAGKINVLGERHFPVRRLTLLDAKEVGGQLTEFEDEPAVIEPIGMGLEGHLFNLYFSFDFGDFVGPHHVYYYRWKDEVEAGAKAALGGRSAAARPDAEQEKRIKQLERALGRSHLQIETLKNMLGE